MAVFETAQNKTKTFEGGYSNIPADKGGETYKGIARNSHPQWKGWFIIDSERQLNSFPKCLELNKTLQLLIEEFYKTNFWDKINGDQIIDQDIANEVYDNAVNMGISTSIRYLQKSLNLLNRNQQKYKDISTDGIIGQSTINAIGECLRYNKRERLLNVINGYQIKHYIELMEKNPTQEIFVGWFDRVAIKWD